MRGPRGGYTAGGRGYGEGGGGQRACTVRGRLSLESFVSMLVKGTWLGVGGRGRGRGTWLGVGGRDRGRGTGTSRGVVRGRGEGVGG